MAAKFDLSSIWRNVKELDLQRIREAAEQEVRLVICGQDADAMQLFANQLRSDPRRPDAATHTPTAIVNLNSAGQIIEADLVLFIISRSEDTIDRQNQVIEALSARGQRTILLLPPDSWGGPPPIHTSAFPALYAHIDNWNFLNNQLAPMILHQLPDLALSLGRSYPLLRETIANELITETSNANAAYSFSTGLAEIVPILGIPLNVADMIILTKAQALLVYKLGLALGLSTSWQYYITEFSGVIGSGFLWRQVARSLIGLIPAWGIVPKVAVAYSGTYAVGRAVLYWYLTGKHASRKMLNDFSREAMGRGKALAKTLRRRLPGGKKETEPQLPEAVSPSEVSPSPDNRICTRCSTINEADANFCKNCGSTIS